MTATVTRFDTTTRAANEAEGLEEREVVRLFEKRKLIGEVDLDDVLEVRGDDWAAELTEFLTTTSDLISVLDFLQTEADEEGDEEEEEEREPGSIVPEKYRILYGSEQNCGDAIAVALSAFVTLPRANKKNPDGGLDRSKLRAVAEVNGIADKLAIWEDRGLNGGLLRMNTSNVLRGMHRRGEEVTIGNETWAAREVEKKVRTRSKKA